jgi:hypothetical protein
MTRFLAILICASLLVLVALGSATAQVSGRSDFIFAHMWISFAARLLAAAGLIVYCGYAALHAVQRVDCPLKRSMWMIVTIGLNAVGSCYYYCTEFQRFREQGLGSLISRPKIKTN